MKKSCLTAAIILSITLCSLAQDIPNLPGIWQWTRNATNVKSGDLGNAQNKNHFVYQIFTTDNKMFIAYALSANELTESNLPNLIANQAAFEGTYTTTGYNINGDVQGNPVPFIYVPETKKIKSTTQGNIELKRVKNFDAQSTTNVNDGNYNGLNGAVAGGAAFGSGGSGPQYLGEEYYGGMKRKIYIAPDGSKYYEGPSGRKVYVEKNGVTIQKTDAIKKAEKEEIARKKKEEKEKLKKSQSQNNTVKKTKVNSGSNTTKSYSAPRSGGGRRGRR